MKQHDRTRSWQMWLGDAYHIKLFAVGVVRRGNRSTLATWTVINIKRNNICMYGIRVILISWVGIYHPVYYFFILDTQYLYTVSTMHNICNLYPWYTIFVSGIHDTQYLCLVSMIHNIYAWITLVTLCIIDPTGSNLYLSNYWRNGNIGRQSRSNHVQKSVT